jgi:hypothetical protein
MVRIVQVFPREDFRVFCYFSDGRIKLWDARPLIGKGVFARIADPEIFITTCTVMNGTLAWDLAGNRDSFSCIDIDPETLWLEGVEVADPLGRIA